MANPCPDCGINGEALLDLFAIIIGLLEIMKAAELQILNPQLLPILEELSDVMRRFSPDA